MIANAADRKSVREAEKRARIAASQRAAVIRSIMTTVEGRAWMWDLLGTAHIFSQTFSTDTHITAFREGQRAMGLALMADILTHCPDMYIQAQREANERYISDDNASRAASGERPISTFADGRDFGREGDDALDTDAVSGLDYDIYRTEARGEA